VIVPVLLVDPLQFTLVSLQPQFTLVFEAILEEWLLEAKGIDQIDKGA
jgi:hypothetical protein